MGELPQKYQDVPAQGCKHSSRSPPDAAAIVSKNPLKEYASHRQPSCTCCWQPQQPLPWHCVLRALAALTSQQRQALRARGCLRRQEPREMWKKIPAVGRPSATSAASCDVTRFQSIFKGPAPASCVRRCRRAAAFGGRNPAKRNSAVGRPDATSAASAAEGPGTGITRRPAAAAAAISPAPGSDTAGMPASLTSATAAPDRRRSSTCEHRAWGSRDAPAPQAAGLDIHQCAAHNQLFLFITRPARWHR